MAQSIKIKLKSFDHKLLEAATRDIVNIVKSTCANVSGPVPLPRSIMKFTLNRSPHIDKKSREQFEVRSQARLISISYPTAQTMDALMKVELSAGVDVQIKVDEGKK